MDDDKLASVDDGWEAGSFTAKIMVRDQIASRVVAGWVKHPFALDFRPGDGFNVWDAAWVLTHIPTGWAAQGILGTLQEAKAMAAEFEQFGDWTFTDAAEAKARFAARVSALRERNPDCLINPAYTIPPWHRQLGGFVLEQAA